MLDLRYPGLVAAYLPPGWPAGVHPPGSDEFEQTAVTWLLDVVPPDYRLHGVLGVTRWRSRRWPGITWPLACRARARGTGPPALSSAASCRPAAWRRCWPPTAPRAG